MQNQTFKEVSVELTHRCPLNCIYCSSEANIGKSKSLDLNRLKEILLEAQSKFHANSVSLSGGEAFLYPNFPELYDFLVKNNFDIMIYTSGVVLDARGHKSSLSTSFLKSLGQKRNTKLILNIQAHNKELVEKINRVPDSYELIKESIQNILNCKLYLGAHIVPFKVNYKYLPQIVDYCLANSFQEVSFLRFVPQGRGIDLDLFNTKSEFAEITQMIASILRHYQYKIKIRLGHPINFLFLTDHSKLNEGEVTHYCRGGFDAPLILPDGEVSMCPAWKNLSEFSAGNIYKQSFEEIWNSTYFKVFRDTIRQSYRNISEPCHSCEYLKICRGKCVAQRILMQKRNGKSGTLEELILSAPDPQCFKDLVGQSEPNLNQKLENYFHDSPLAFMKAIPAHLLEFDERASYMCKFGCKNYNRKHSCPPESLKVLEKIKKKDYRWAIIFATTSQVPDKYSTYRLRALNRKKEIEIQRVCNHLEGILNADNTPHMTLSGGSCKQCQECSNIYGQVCKKPQLKLVSMEAVGIDCQKTLHSAGFDFQMPQKGSINRCGCILTSERELSEIHFNSVESLQTLKKPTKRDASSMCLYLSREYPHLFDSVQLVPLVKIVSYCRNELCYACAKRGKNFACPPFSQKIDLNLWNNAVLWKWKQNNSKQNRYNIALKTVHSAFFSLGYYFSFSFRDCYCNECNPCRYSESERPICNSRKILSPSMQSQGINPTSFGDGKFGLELF